MKFPKVKKNFIDRAIESVAPVLGAKRYRARVSMAMAERYSGASKTRRSLSDWSTLNEDQNDINAEELATLQSRSGDLLRNNTIANSAINCNVSHVVGTGITAKSAIDSVFLGLNDQQTKEIEDIVDRVFRLWGKTELCNVERLFNYNQLQEVALRSSLEYGDCWVVITEAEYNVPIKTALQVFEAPRVCNPNDDADSEKIMQGVEVGSYGEPVAIHVKSTLSVKFGTATWSRIPIYNDKGEKQVLQIVKRKAWAVARCSLFGSCYRGNQTVRPVL